MSNPMLAGLGIKATDTRFKLPDIKTSGGKAYKPAAPKEKVEAHAENAKAAGPDDDVKEMDTSTGLVFSMCATIVAANKEVSGTAAHFWREAAREMRLENSRRKDKWAEWAEEQAGREDKAKEKLKLPPPDKTPDPDHGAQFLACDVKRYRNAVSWAKKARAAEKEEAAKPKGKPAPSAKKGGLNKLDIALVASNDALADSPREKGGRANKAYWKKDNGTGGDSDDSSSDGSDSDSDSDSEEDRKKKKGAKKGKKGKNHQEEKAAAKGKKGKAGKDEKKKKKEKGRRSLL